MVSTSNNATELQAIIDKALLNELILEMIFQQLPIRELKMCRLACSKWNHIAVKEIQAKNWNDRKVLNYSQPLGETDGRHQFEAYLNLFSNSPDNLPYLCHAFNVERQFPPGHVLRPIDLNVDKQNMRKFFVTFKKQIKGLSIGNGLTLCVQDILQICGESLAELAISVMHGYIVTKYPDELEIMKASKNHILLPNLKSISLNNVIQEPNIPSMPLIMSHCNTNFKNILSNMRPNSLEELNFHNWGRFDLVVEHLIEFNQVKNLKILSLYPNSDSDGGDLLIFKKKGIQLQLKQLTIQNESPSMPKRWSSGSMDIDPKELYEFLMTQINSLEDLNLACSIYIFPSNMKAIKTLNLRILENELVINTIAIDFAASFPNIINLYLWNNIYHQRHNFRYNLDDESKKDHQILSMQEPCNSLRKLALPEILPLSLAVFTRILNIFPKLSSLELMVISPEVFLRIWNSDEFADTLTVLILWIAGRDERGPVFMPNSLQLDQIFSGVSQQEIVSISSDEFSEEFVFDEPQCNSILRLKNLRKLHINWVASRWYQLHSLTDFAGLRVFEKMKNMTDLFIHQNTHRFSDDCISRLKKNIHKFSCQQQQGKEILGDPRYHSSCHISYYLKRRMSRVHVF